VEDGKSAIQRLQITKANSEGFTFTAAGAQEQVDEVLKIAVLHPSAVQARLSALDMLAEMDGLSNRQELNLRRRRANGGRCVSYRICWQGSVRHCEGEHSAKNHAQLAGRSTPLSRCVSPVGAAVFHIGEKPVKKGDGDFLKPHAADGGHDHVLDLGAVCRQSLGRQGPALTYLSVIATMLQPHRRERVKGRAGTQANN
jgi:hypothetical protein